MTYRQLQIYFFLGLIIAVGALTVMIFRPYLGPLVLGGTFAIIFMPLYRRIVLLLRGRESLSALLTIAFIVVVVVVPLFYFGLRVFDEGRNLYVSLTNGAGDGLVGDVFERLRGKITLVIPDEYVPSYAEIARDARQYAQQALGWILQNVGTIFSSLTKVLFGMFLSLFALYYLLKDGKRLKRAVIEYSPLADEYDKQIFSKLSQVVNSVIRGALVIAVIQGLLSGIGYFIFGVPNAVIWGLVTVFAALVPSVGTALVTMPAALFLFLSGNVFGAFGMFLWAVVLVGLIDNFISPKILERGLHIHPFLILLSVLGGLSVFGVLGFIIGPLSLSLFLALLDIYKEEFKKYTEDLS